jgi:DNA polymerase-1
MEVLNVLLPQLDPHTSATYDFSRALQGPALEMRLRGIRIDQHRKNQVIDEYIDAIDQLEGQLDRLVTEGCGMPGFGWTRNRDLMELFYDRLNIPVIRRGGRPTVNREALEKLEQYLVAKPIVSHITAMRELQKRISVLQTEIDPDGRMRTSYNIAGTSTGRFSSSFSDFGTGTNLQNIEEFLRSIFIADSGMKLAYIDAQQGESRVVGAIEWNLFQDGKYLDACEGGDLHTSVAKLCWPKLDWPGDAGGDRELAEQRYYRHYNRRFMCKKIGHGSNYGGKPATLAAQAKLDVRAVEDFQQSYFHAFPAKRKWHEWTSDQLRRHGNVVSLTGRKRWFWGRRNDDSTLREAVAYQGQALGDILNRGMLQVWRSGVCQLLMQIHDAILVQYPEDKEDEVIPKILKAMEVPIKLNHGREFIIPYDCTTGWNWGKHSKDNPDGLQKYQQDSLFKRKRTKEVHILDRPVR